MQQSKSAIVSHCQQLVAAFAVLVDARCGDAVAELFAQDGRFERRGATLAGREEIRAAQSRRPPDLYTQHLCFQSHIEVIDETSARGVTPFLLYRIQCADPAAPALPLSLAAPEMVGRFEDEFRRTTDGWRIQHRRAVLVLAGQS
ncbi:MULTISPECIES: nuclear transport factor 2 family protein [unclassified Variovorax]|uniref:nuclear transport factor 2 family protein n=1 Tax=unclassified Variovorax TaxID=663243 RepID=UPI001BD4D8FE|nr:MULTISPECIES: nuclear transport factor 2 family protein [unclassified Variovorax]